jgi:hypothetical protein
MRNILLFMTLLKRLKRYPNSIKETKEWRNSALRAKPLTFSSIANNLGEKLDSINKKL